MVSLVLGGDKESYHTQVVAVSEPPVEDVSGVEVYGNEGVMEDVDQTQLSCVGEHVHMDQRLAHREAVTQNLEDSADMGSPLAPLAVGEGDGDHTLPHEGGSRVVGSPGHLRPFSK